MEDIKNEVYFSGGGNPALFRKTTDQASQLAWRRGLTKISDNRVTDTNTADILSQSEINRNKDPQYAATMTLLDRVYIIENVKLGQLIGFANAGNFIDDLFLQVAERKYSPDKLGLTLNKLPPEVSKRVEDIKRNLEVLEAQNNPNTPG